MRYQQNKQKTKISPEQTKAKINHYISIVYKEKRIIEKTFL